MKQKIKVKVLTGGCLPEISKKGDWIDLRAAKDVYLLPPHAEMLKKHSDNRYRIVEFENEIIPLGVIIQLPAGMEAIINPRSSTFEHYGVIIPHSQGVIDNSYCGPNDEWKLPVVALRECKIPALTRICQFKIQPSQKATFWQKLKWLFSNGVEIEVIEEVKNPNRGGFGSSGKN